MVCHSTSMVWLVAHLNINILSTYGVKPVNGGLLCLTSVTIRDRRSSQIVLGCV